MSWSSESSRKHSRFLRHATGVAGAVTLMNVFKDLAEWPSFIWRFIEWWQEYVRPFVQSCFWWLVEIWPLAWPEWAYDYIVFCIVFGLGGVRFFQLFIRPREEYIHDRRTFVDGTAYVTVVKKRTSWKSVFRLILLFFTVALFWPAFLVFLALFSFISWINDEFSQPLREALFLALSPFLYFMLLLFLSYSLLFAGVK